MRTCNAAAAEQTIVGQIAITDVSVGLVVSYTGGAANGNVCALV